MNSTEGMGLNYVPVDMDSGRMILYTDWSFANAPDLRSQLGFVSVLLHDQGSANIIHYGSARYHRVTRSVMAS